MTDINNKKVLITGGAGFIGANFVHHLVTTRPDWTITVVDSLTYAGNFNNISSLVERGEVEFIKEDITDQIAMNLLFRKGKFNFVFNFAAESHVDRSINSSTEFIKTNVLGTHNLLTNSISEKISRFVHISTDEVYGSIENGSFTEHSNLDPSSPYSSSKAASDLIALSFAKTYSLDVVVTRCTNNYGPFQFPEKFIPLFITNAIENKKVPLYGDGLNIRSWLYVTDHCDAILKVAEKGISGSVYNIGGSSEAEITNINVAKKILDTLGKDHSLITPVADRPAHDRRYSIDYTKIKNELGWEPKISFEIGIKKTIEWYQKNQSWWKTILSGEYKNFYELNYSRIDVVGQ